MSDRCPLGYLFVSSRVPFEEVYFEGVWRGWGEGSQTELPYSRTGRTSPLYADTLITSCGHAKATKDPIRLLAFVQILLTCSWIVNH